MKIDSHFHIGLNGYNTVESIIDYLDKNNIDKIWLLSWEEIDPISKRLYQSLPIENIWDAYLAFPDRIVPFYAPDPKREDCLKTFIDWNKKGVRGFAELKVAINWDDERLIEVLEYLNEESLPLIVHMEEPSERRIYKGNGKLSKFLFKYSSKTKWKGTPSKALSFFSYFLKSLKSKINDSFDIVVHPGYMLDFLSFEKVIVKYPNIKFIGHGPMFWKGIASDYNSNKLAYPNGKIEGKGISYELLLKYSNLYADLSGPSAFYALKRDRAFSKEMLVELKNKLLFGTDNFDFKLDVLLDDLIEDVKVKDLIMGENALKIINNG